MAPPRTQTAIVQSQQNPVPSNDSTCRLALTISHSVRVPDLPSANHVLVRILAVALNPTDHKMVTHFPTPGNLVGCDFCGVVEESPCPVSGTAVANFPSGTRVCGSVFSYNPDDSHSAAFAQWVVADSRLLLRVPYDWDDLQGAALGGVGWGTAGLAFYDPDALALQGRPSKPTAKEEPVLVYGGGTASGTVACQLLKLSAYRPIAVTSTKSASLAEEYGAVGTAPYTFHSCADTIRSLADGTPIRHDLDCITRAESVGVCFTVMARTGGRYTRLEGLNEAWRTRRAIHTKEVMGFEGLGIRIDLGPTSYSREANQELFRVCARWATEMQSLLDAGLIRTHPIWEVSGQWRGIIDGLVMLQRGEVRAQKLVIRV